MCLETSRNQKLSMTCRLYTSISSLYLFISLKFNQSLCLKQPSPGWFSSFVIAAHIAILHSSSIDAMLRICRASVLLQLLKRPSIAYNLYNLDFHDKLILYDVDSKFHTNPVLKLISITEKIFVPVYMF